MVTNETGLPLTSVSNKKDVNSSYKATMDKKAAKVWQIFTTSTKYVMVDTNICLTKSGANPSPLSSLTLIWVGFVLSSPEPV